MYKLLVRKSEFEGNLSIVRALKLAKDYGANVLIADGFSIREAVILANQFKNKVKKLDFGIAKPPTVTSTALSKQLGEPSIAKLVEKGYITKIGKKWRIIHVDPSKLGCAVKASDTIFITDLPDGALHRTITRRRKIISEDTIIGQLHKIIEKLSALQPLIITGDHGYIYLNLSPSEYMWDRIITSSRYGDVKILEEVPPINVDNTLVAVGRCHLPSERTLIIHGGISFLESLVPILILH